MRKMINRSPANYDDEAFVVDVIYPGPDITEKSVSRPTDSPVRPSVRLCERIIAAHRTWWCRDLRNVIVHCYRILINWRTAMFN